jgi:hypothetical protein
MATGTLSLHGRFVTYDLYVLWKAGEKLSMVLHSIHPHNAIYCAVSLLIATIRRNPLKWSWGMATGTHSLH